MCEMLGWENVDQFKLYPMNSPSLLILWRPLITTLEEVDNEHCKRFREGNLSLGSAKKRKVDRGEKIASHFHLDRTRLQLFGPTSNAQPEDLMVYKIKKSPTMWLVESWSFQNPGITQKEFKFNGTWKVAIGLYPKMSEQFSEEICKTMASLIKEPGIAAL